MLSGWLTLPTELFVTTSGLMDFPIDQIVAWIFDFYAKRNFISSFYTDYFKSVDKLQCLQKTIHPNAHTMPKMNHKKQ